MIDKKLYDETSIESLSPLEFTRLKPGVYAGDTTYATQLLVEIISNAIDEYNLGHGNKIDVTIDGDIITVRDYGQGFIPNSYREDNKTILEAAFSVLNTSGKYREDGTYEGTSLGSFGIGSKITTFLSHWLSVKTWRNNEFEYIFFKEGVFEERDSTPHGSDCKQANGTEVSWQASEEFFTHSVVEIDKVKNLFETIVCLCPGLTINLDFNKALYTYSSQNGINDLVDKLVKDKELIDNRLNINYSNGKNKMDLVLTYTSNYSSTIVPYVNTGLTESGQHITQIKTTITREFNKFFKSKGWLKEKDDNLTGDDIQEGMYVVFNITAPNVAYDAQVKSRITKIDMYPFTSALSENIEYWLINNEKEIKNIFDKAAAAKKAREAAKKAREQVREQKKEKEKAIKVASKLADCSSKKRSECEIYITEGDSASGNLKMARDNKIQAVFPIRGKMLNTHKTAWSKIMGNAEIVTFFKALGLDWDPIKKRAIFDEKKLRYGKIIIASDADVDGSHIKNLVYTVIWDLCPELLFHGYVYSLEAPLYRIVFTNGTSTYLQNDELLEQWRTSYNGSKKYEIKRFKGLGEMDPDETRETLTDIEHRVLTRVTIDEVERTSELIEDLMGTPVGPRKKFIVENSEKAGLFNAE